MDDVCETESDGAFYRDLDDSCFDVSIAVSRQRLTTGVMGSARFGVHCKLSPVHLMVDDGRKNLQYPKVPLYRI
jgi:hypothetical protein